MYVGAGLAPTYKIFTRLFHRSNFLVTMVDLVMCGGGPGSSLMVGGTSTGLPKEGTHKILEVVNSRINTTKLKVGLGVYGIQRYSVWNMVWNMEKRET